MIGKRTQPFGAFYERLVTDPTSEDAYEANQVGVTVGYKNKALWNLDASVTAYRQEELMDHFFDSQLFDSRTIVRSTTAGLRDESDNIESVIGAVNVTPLTDLTIGGGLSSEPGDGRRNQTATWGPLTAEAEFYIAVSRQNYVRQTTTEDPASRESTTTPVRLGQSFEEKLLSFELDTQLSRGLDACLAAADKIPDPLETAMKTPRSRPTVERLLKEVGTLRHAVPERLTTALSVPLGFNALDGD